MEDIIMFGMMFSYIFGISLFIIYMGLSIYEKCRNSIEKIEEIEKTDISCPICKEGNLKQVKSHLFKYQICDKCYATKSGETWLRTSKKIIGLSNDNSPIFEM